MADALSSQFYVRGAFLREQLRLGDPATIESARESLRTAMVAQYASGYWKENPKKLREYMDLLYQCDQILFRRSPNLRLAENAPASLHR